MGAAVPFIPMAISAIGGLFKGKGDAQKQQSQQTSTTNQSSSNRAVLTGDQDRLYNTMMQRIMEMFSAGPKVSQADKNARRTSLNDMHNARVENASAHLSSRGYGNRTGQMGKAIKASNVEREKSFANLDSVLEGEAWDKYMGEMQMLLPLSAAPRQFDQSGTSTSSGSYTQPGTSPWSSLGAGLGDLSSWLYLQGMGGRGNTAGLPTGSSNMGSVLGSMPRPYCYVAAELYGGWQDWRTQFIRTYLHTQAARSWRWAIALEVYKLTGRAVAWAIRHSATLRRPFKRLFDWVLARAFAAA